MTWANLLLVPLSEIRFLCSFISYQFELIQIFLSPFKSIRLLFKTWSYQILFICSMQSVWRLFMVPAWNMSLDRSLWLHLLHWWNNLVFCGHIWHYWYNYVNGCVAETTESRSLFQIFDSFVCVWLHFSHYGHSLHCVTIHVLLVSQGYM